MNKYEQLDATGLIARSLMRYALWMYIVRKFNLKGICELFCYRGDAERLILSLTDFLYEVNRLMAGEPAKKIRKDRRVFLFFGITPESFLKWARGKSVYYGGMSTGDIIACVEETTVSIIRATLSSRCKAHPSRSVWIDSPAAQILGREALWELIEDNFTLVSVDLSNRIESTSKELGLDPFEVGEYIYKVVPVIQEVSQTEVMKALSKSKARVMA